MEISQEKLIELNITIKDEWNSGGNRDPIKLYFKTNEYSNGFGIYVGGTFGRWTEVTKTLESGRRLSIKIREDDTRKLNLAVETIPIFYLKDPNFGIVFNEKDFDKGERNSFYRIAGFLIIIFIIGLFKILKE